MGIFLVGMLNFKHFLWLCLIYTFCKLDIGAVPM